VGVKIADFKTGWGVAKVNKNGNNANKIAKFMVFGGACL
jgi:hypothetical protein